MAFSGLHVICAEAGDPLRSDAFARAEVIQNAWWSETLASAGTTTQAAPAGAVCLFRVRSSADAWFAIGSAPDASQAVGNSRTRARHFLPAGEPYDVNVSTGDKLAWIAA